VSDSVGTAAGPQFEALSHGRLSWIYVERPSDLESELLGRHYHLRPSHLAEALSGRATVRALESGSYVYLSLETPSQNRVSRTISISHAGVFVGSDFVICVHRAMPARWRGSSASASPTRRDSTRRWATSRSDWRWPS
jgi:Mg2+ and Co2+ transporter CorA